MWLAISAAVLLCAFAAIGGLLHDPTLAVTAGDVEQGMSREQIEAVLGPPRKPGHRVNLIDDLCLDELEWSDGIMHVSVQFRGQVDEPPAKDQGYSMTCWVERPSPVWKIRLWLERLIYRNVPQVVGVSTISLEKTPD
jgi:hypothetical protein